MSDQTGHQMGANSMNIAFADSTGFGINPETGTRSDFTESASLASGGLVEMPQDVGYKREAADPAPSRRAEGGATYDPSSQMTAQARHGARQEAETEHAKTLPRQEHPGEIGVSRAAVEDFKDEVGSLEGRLGSTVPQTRDF
ncbi:hypothetical protein CERSUDRAFT_93008 [Gelatoporia subvermispora B]|uniref:Uncharacterized protein n=1 Tax=Ceriporiopsis subvermispora (strain B) TaxID=914234 RepID=M2QPK4_CERS8|nr:hypothetical protein CERSUDRAFT_93008 [Gelatoporia subvermispora B]